METWTCVATCQHCGKELNRAERVPESAKQRVAMSSPLVALCDDPTHNSTPDVNYGVVLTWTKDEE